MPAAISDAMAGAAPPRNDECGGHLTTLVSPTDSEVTIDSLWASKYASTNGGLTEQASEDEPRQASQMSTTKKITIAATIILMNFNVTMGSSLPSGSTESLQAAFKVNSTLQAPLPVSMFLTGYILGPLIFAPMSEFYGRQMVFFSSFGIYTIFLAGCAVAPNWPAFLIFRFLMGCGAAAPQTVSGGLFADLYDDLVPRGRAMTLLGLTSNVGPLIGPIISGFTAHRGWQFQFYVALILAAVNWPPLLMMPETFAPVVAARSAASAKHPFLRAFAAKNQRTGLHFSLARTVTRPLYLLREPLVLLSDLFILYQYIIFFLYFNIYPVVFKGIYGMSDSQSSLMFLPTGIGAVIAIGIFLWWDAYHAKSAKLGKAWALREEYRRLPLACLGGPLFALAEFWLGWAARKDIHWAVPALSGIPLGIGIDLTFLALQNYLTDAYGVYSASALASSVITRNVLAAALLPTVSFPLYEILGTAWACTLLGGLCTLLVPIPFAFIKWGPKMRANSPFCEALKSQR